MAALKTQCDLAGVRFRWGTEVREREWALVIEALTTVTTPVSVQNFSATIAGTFRASDAARRVATGLPGTSAAPDLLEALRMPLRRTSLPPHA